MQTKKQLIKHISSGISNQFKLYLISSGKANKLISCLDLLVLFPEPKNDSKLEFDLKQGEV